MVLTGRETNAGVELKIYREYRDGAQDAGWGRVAGLYSEYGVSVVLRRMEEN